MAAQSSLSLMLVPGVGSLSTFRFLDQHVRVLQRADGEPWFVAADVCAALDLGNPTMALRRLDDEKALNSIEGLSKLAGGNEQANIINESGLYSLILTSRKPEAKRFKKWVTADMLPAIRRQGYYTTSNVATRERLAQVRLARQLAIDVGRSKDEFTRTVLVGLLGEVANSLGQVLPALKPLGEASKEEG